MKFLDVLARLGILRWGKTAATYKSGAERPPELMMDGVLDARRDLSLQNGRTGTSSDAGHKSRKPD